MVVIALRKSFTCGVNSEFVSHRPPVTELADVAYASLCSVYMGPTHTKLKGGLKLEVRRSRQELCLLNSYPAFLNLLVIWVVEYFQAFAIPK